MNFLQLKDVKATKYNRQMADFLDTLDTDFQNCLFSLMSEHF